MAEFDTRVHRALANGSRVRLLRALRASDRPLAAQDLAEQVDLHLSTVRAHLDALIEAELVASEREERTTPGRPRVLYRPTGQTQPQETGGYRLLAEVLAGQLAAVTAHPAEQARAAGRAWGQYLVERPPPFATLSVEEARATVMELFAGLGFEPELDETGSRILCRRCPFLDVARRHPDVVCSIHLGLLQGALDTLGSALSADQLDPLVEPSLCVAHLNGTAPS